MDRFEGWIRRIFVNTSIEHFRKALKSTTLTEVQEITIKNKEWNTLDTLAYHKNSARLKPRIQTSF
jgi:DNA-directed RNA polymerase specialized sigma24 family protein